MYGKLKKPCRRCGQDDRGSQGQCKPCRAVWQRNWNAKNPEMVKATYARWATKNPALVVTNARRTHLRKYGLSLAEYEELLSRQNGKCAICLTTRPNGPGKVFMVDHDHSTNAVRGLLCCHCNFLLGHARNDVRLLEQAMAYLKQQGG